MCLLSDAAVMSVWPTMKPYLTAGKALYFSHGFAITWNDRTGVVPPADIDVIMVAPKGSGTSLRSMFLEGRGLNSSFAIYQDATGKAMDRTLALGIGIGSGYLFETTFIREATSDLTGERGSLMGKEKMERLRKAHVLVVGVGGVGAYAAEMICRAGVGQMTLVDADTVQPTNINRQLPATHSVLGKPKAEVLAARFRDINPDLKLTVLPVYLKDEAIPELLDSAHFDFIVDAIDTVAPKCYLIYHALQRGLKIVSSMGAGAKRDITQVRFADLWETYHCGLSKAVRKRLQKMGMKRRLPVVFSTEQADPEAVILVENEQNKKSTAGTVSYMPAVFGCYLAEYVIRKL